MRYFPLAMLVVYPLCVGSIHAEDIMPSANTDIVFEGVVTDQTCTVAINGENDGHVLVKLPPVHKTQLAEKDAVAGKTTFNIAIVGCEKKGQVNGVEIKFKANGWGEDGYLTNILNDEKSAKGVALKLIDEDTGDTLIKDKNDVVKLDLPDGQKASEHTFAVQYVRTADKDEDVTSGPIKATVTAEMSYY